MNICENNNIIIDISRNSSSSNFSSTLLKKVEPQNNINNNNLNIIPIKNETSTKYKKAFDILNNMNNNKYTMKYIEENKLRSKNIENDLINNINVYNYNRNSSPIYLNNNIKYKNNNNRSSSCLNNNKLNNNNLKSEKFDKHKNRSMKKNNIKLNIKDKEKIKDNNNNNIHEYKINNLSSSYNNNFTNIKTNKIVFIDLKDNDNSNFLQSDLNNDNQNENNRYTRNINNNIKDEINDNNNIMFRSGGNSNTNCKNLKNLKSNNNINNNISNNSNNKLNIVNKKNNINNIEEKIILRSKNKNEVNNNFNINNNKNKFSDLIIQKLDKNISGNIPNNFIILEDNKKKDIISPKNIKFESLKNKGISNKESAYYILSKSPILRLCERMIFSRTSSNLRNILSKENILNEHEIILNKKIEELEKKIILCDKILDTPFTASKTADITLNFITSLQEIEFREFPILLSNEEEKKYYLNYLKILYHLFEEEIDNKTKENNLIDENNIILNLRQNLYSKIYSKGFRSIRDYLYNIYITKKEYIKEIPKIAEINYLVSQVNNMFEIHNSLKICKFISFTLYLVKEIVNFGNNIKSTIELKIKAKNLIDIINKKLNRFNSKYKIK